VFVNRQQLLERVQNWGVGEGKILIRGQSRVDAGRQLLDFLQLGDDSILD
jgi:hypothetical protein